MLKTGLVRYIVRYVTKKRTFYRKQPVFDVF